MIDVDAPGLLIGGHRAWDLRIADEIRVEVPLRPGDPRRRHGPRAVCWGRIISGPTSSWVGGVVSGDTRVTILTTLGVKTTVRARHITDHRAEDVASIRDKITKRYHAST